MLERVSIELDGSLHARLRTQSKSVPIEEFARYQLRTVYIWSISCAKKHNGHLPHRSYTQGVSLVEIPSRSVAGPVPVRMN